MTCYMVSLGCTCTGRCLCALLYAVAAESQPGLTDKHTIPFRDISSNPLLWLHIMHTHESKSGITFTLGSRRAHNAPGLTLHFRPPGASPE
jgi:hypothetical protein